jgi:hypothetical protein
MTDTNDLRVALFEAMGWQWYRLPANSISADRTYRCLFHPSLFEIPDGKPPKGFTRADMTERVCNMAYMEKEGIIGPLDHNLIAQARGLLVTEELRDRYTARLISNFEPGYRATPSYFDLIDMTVDQHAAAILSALGKLPKDL